jgi:hypothetical protein
MPVDTRPFPKNVRVIVRNDNRPEDKTGGWSGNIQFQFDGELYDFPPGKPVIIGAEAAYHLFLFDTRCERDQLGKDIPDRPRNYRDTFSTGAIGNSGIGQQPTLYMLRLMSYGWANSKELGRRFDNFTIEAVPMNATIDPEAFNKILKRIPKEVPA